MAKGVSPSAMTSAVLRPPILELLGAGASTIGVAIGRQVFADNTDILFYSMFAFGIFAIAFLISIVGPKPRPWRAPVYLILGGALLGAFNILDARFEEQMFLVVLIPLGGAFSIVCLLSLVRGISQRSNPKRHNVA